MMSQTPLTSTEQQRAGSDQAHGLRALVAQRRASNAGRTSTARTCRSIVVAGGKGGTGRSIVALNLAISLAQRGQAVGLLDASSEFGSIELLCGMNGYWNLSHVLQGCRQFDEVVHQGPLGIKIISGASCLTERFCERDSSRLGLNTVEQLLEFERTVDWLIVDASGASPTSSREFAWAADDLLVVATPETTAVAEAYASIKTFASGGSPRLGLLINQAESAAQAQQILDHLQHAAHSFLDVDLHRRGFIPRDSVVSASVSRREPFVLQSPKSAATAAMEQLAQRWTRPARRENEVCFFERLQKGDE
ncbi:P-loop NTPase [Schlesneria paludicola]|uniref:P-loop NTPase n=1 Tax=Schlesneria paludicola TaxID=360056 RepID=UPI00029A10DF|nr:P-loop NTPase [Schlesneria paludicola]